MAATKMFGGKKDRKAPITPATPVDAQHLASVKTPVAPAVAQPSRVGQEVFFIDPNNPAANAFITTDKNGKTVASTGVLATGKGKGRKETKKISNAELATLLAKRGKEIG